MDISNLISDKKEWYAIYTRSRFEKNVCAKLLQKEVESFLPLQKQVRQWSDRKKTVEIPLIKSYVFVYIDYSEYLRVLQTDGVVRFITYLGKSNPAPIPDEQINNLKILTQNNIDFEIVENKINPGEKIEVITGAFFGLKGELVEYHGNKKVVVRIDHLNTSILVTVPAFQIKTQK